MKYIAKGVGLGLTLTLVNRFCCMVSRGEPEPQLFLSVVLAFFAVTLAFLISDRVRGVFVCGFCGLFVMIATELLLLVSEIDLSVSQLDTVNRLIVYTYGFWGSTGAIPAAIVFSVKKRKIFGFLTEVDVVMEKMDRHMKIKLLCYTLITMIGFSYLVMPENSGVSVPIFALIQLACLWFLVPERKRMILFVPILVMAFNCFWSASDVWRLPNFFVAAVLFGGMLIKVDIKKDCISYIPAAVRNIRKAFERIVIPFRWIGELSDKKVPALKRIGLALLIAVPCAVVLIFVLANADMVFSIKTKEILSDTSGILKFNTLFIGLCGIFVGLYAFGVVYNAYAEGETDDTYEWNVKGDLLIINIIVSVILVVYTLFAAVQFKYLFAGSTLPQGLTYTEYARKGFFELLALTGVNIAGILVVVKFTKNCSGKGAVLAKLLCHYLCAVTVVLLVSSFYRMMLYTGDDGLTRLRFFVLGFLVFEAIGLLATFVYIAKPGFNITLIYLGIALTYYTVLNIVPVDGIIAKNQIEKYMNGERDNIYYVYSLSADAVPALAELYEKTDDEAVKDEIRKFVEERTASDIPERWQRYNLSVEIAKGIGEEIRN